MNHDKITMFKAMTCFNTFYNKLLKQLYSQELFWINFDDEFDITWHLRLKKLRSVLYKNSCLNIFIY